MEISPFDRGQPRLEDEGDLSTLLARLRAASGCSELVKFEILYKGRSTLPYGYAYPAEEEIGVESVGATQWRPQPIPAFTSWIHRY